MKNATATKTKTSNKQNTPVPVPGGAALSGQVKPELKLVGGTDFKDQFHDLPLDSIEIVENWRKKFDTPEFTLFVQNVRDNGILEPILVSGGSIAGKYSLIAGERRLRAAKEAGLETIPARFLELSEGDRKNAHIAENLQRSDLEPMEEAEGYFSLIETERLKGIHLSVTEIARRVGKTAEHVALRLQLNKLIPEAKQDLRNGWLEPKTAETVASYPPDQQREIYGFCYDTVYLKGKQVADKTKPKSLRFIKDRIASDITLDLAFAPFSLKSTELRNDKVNCHDCTTNTGSRSLLFKELNDSKKNLCLDKTCYLAKTARHIELVQITVARQNIVKALPKAKKGEKLPEPSKKELAGEVAKIPRLSPSYYEYNDETVLGTKHYTEIKKAKEACDSAVKGVFIKGDRCGQVITICLASSKCQTHYKTYSSTTPVKSGDEHRKNRQQLFDLRADQVTRRKVMAASVAQFDEQKTVWNDKTLRDLMLASMLQSIGYNERHRRELIAELLDLEEKSLENDTWGAADKKIFEIYEKVSKLSDAVQSKIFFLLTVGSFGENENENRGVKQDQVRFLADHLGVDYTLLGAEAMVDLCAARYKKQLPEAKMYLEQIGKTIEPVPVPKFFFDFEAEKKAAEIAAAGDKAEIPEVEDKAQIAEVEDKMAA